MLRPVGEEITEDEGVRRFRGALFVTYHLIFVVEQFANNPAPPRWTGDPVVIPGADYVLVRTGLHTGMIVVELGTSERVDDPPPIDLDEWDGAVELDMPVPRAVVVSTMDGLLGDPPLLTPADMAPSRLRIAYRNRDLYAPDGTGPADADAVLAGVEPTEHYRFDTWPTSDVVGTVLTVKSLQ